MIFKYIKAGFRKLIYSKIKMIIYSIKGIDIGDTKAKIVRSRWMLQYPKDRQKVV